MERDRSTHVPPSQQSAQGPVPKGGELVEPLRPEERSKPVVPHKEEPPHKKPVTHHPVHPQHGPVHHARSHK